MVARAVLQLGTQKSGIWLESKEGGGRDHHSGKGKEEEEEEGRREGGLFMVREVGKEGMRLGKYELGRTLGEGNFGKVKLARNVETGQAFAVKILEKKRILDLKIDDQLIREIGTLKLLKHPNVVRLYEALSSYKSMLGNYSCSHTYSVLQLLKKQTNPSPARGTWPCEVIASKTKICMVLEYVTGGELFDKIARRRWLPEDECRKVFQQLIDAVSYCHNKGVFHRDLKPENVLVDARGNIKISDFGLSALPQHFRVDGLLHTTCGSPNYVAPEVIANRGYDGATADLWSCGVILYVALTGCLPFDDNNMVVLYQKINKGRPRFPSSSQISAGARNMVWRILDPNPKTRISIAEIKEDAWFKESYCPANPDDEDEDINIDDEAFSIQGPKERDSPTNSSTLINAFQLIGMSSSLDLSGFFEKEDVSDRKIRFTSNYSPKDLLERIEDIVTEMGFRVLKRNGKLKVMQDRKDVKSPGSLSVSAEVFELSPSLYVVELRKSYGDSSLYRQFFFFLQASGGVWQASIVAKLRNCGQDVNICEARHPWLATKCNLPVSTETTAMV
ncbi:CBL-interacting serine/threonine-protein kinase 1 [Asimina triloba]